MTNNNAYLKVKIDQIDAQKKKLRAEIKRLDDRRKAYDAQRVDETTAQPDAPQTDD